MKIRYGSPGIGFLDTRYVNITGDQIVPTSNSTTTFGVQQADGTQVFNVDTTNKKVTVTGRDILIYSFMMGDF